MIDLATQGGQQFLVHGAVGRDTLGLRLLAKCGTPSFLRQRVGKRVLFDGQCRDVLTESRPLPRLELEAGREGVTLGDERIEAVIRITLGRDGCGRLREEGQLGRLVRSGGRLAELDELDLNCAACVTIATASPWRPRRAAARTTEAWRPGAIVSDASDVCGARMVPAHLARGHRNDDARRIDGWRSRPAQEHFSRGAEPVRGREDNRSPGRHDVVFESLTSGTVIAQNIPLRKEPV